MKNKIERTKKFKHFSVHVNNEKNRIVNISSGPKLNNKSGYEFRFGKVKGIYYQSDINDNLINISITNNYQNSDGTINANFYTPPFYSPNLLNNDNLEYTNSRLFLCPLDTYLNKIEAESDSIGIIAKSLSFGCIGPTMNRGIIKPTNIYFRYVFIGISIFLILFLFYKFIL
uniref:Uncharacterized protein n=1 Tax=viral metagenome TaxID=1070528 RepID=A0A6C0J9G0_9ZZZZ